MWPLAFANTARDAVSDAARYTHFKLVAAQSSEPYVTSFIRRGRPRDPCVQLSLNKHVTLRLREQLDHCC